jgi:hypothetical protein
MCLTTVTQGPNAEEEGEGWKVFNENYVVFDTTGRKVGGHLCSPLKFFWFSSNRWEQDICFKKIKAEDGLEYESGFHIFEKKEDAERYLASFVNPSQKVIKKIKYRNVTAKGPNRAVLYSECDYEYFDLTVPCVVAKEIFVFDEEPTKCAS